MARAPTYYGYVRVFYPLHHGRLVLRTEQDWDRDVEPEDVCAISGGQRFDFLLAHDRPHLFMKAVVHDEGGERWAAGANKLVILSEVPQDVYPHFLTGDRGRITEVLECPSQVLGRSLRLRAYLPAGYDENHLKRYPVLYMHDGKNLFFPDESFLGQEWHIDSSLDLLDSMSLIERLIVIGVHAEQRNAEYTLPGYERYGRAFVEDLKPWVDRTYRTLARPERTAVMGSSLGGVVSFYLGWEWPEVFGYVACLSSAFGYRDDLFERVRDEPVESRRKLRIYLDSGWPADNYEVTLSMANALIKRGFAPGRDLYHLAFPLARHAEAAWSARVHIPLQLFSGKLQRAAERHAERPATTAQSASRQFKLPAPDGEQ